MWIYVWFRFVRLSVVTFCTVLVFSLSCRFFVICFIDLIVGESKIKKFCWYFREDSCISLSDFLTAKGSDVVVIQFSSFSAMTFYTFSHWY